MMLDDKAKLKELLDDLKLPREEVRRVFVNGKWEAESYLLRDGDKIGIFPPIAGG